MGPCPSGGRGLHRSRKRASRCERARRTGQGQGAIARPAPREIGRDGGRCGGDRPISRAIGGRDRADARPQRGAGGGAGDDRHRDRQGAGADRLARFARRAGICRRSIDHHPRRRRNRRADRGTQKERAMTARRGWIIAAVLLALLLLAATFPMRLTLAWSGATDAGVAAREVRGSVWSGELVEARLGALPLGTVRASLSPLALLGGSVELAFSRTDERLGALAGRLYGSDPRGMSDVSGTTSMAGGLGAVPVEIGRAHV